MLVLEEAGALDLVTPFVLTALQELRKAGLSIRLITQSSLDFGDPSRFQSILANMPWQGWYQCLAPADQELGAKALANATFDPLAVHYTRPRVIADGVRPVVTESRGGGIDLQTGSRREDWRAGTTFLATHREVAEPQYKSPQLHEQGFRTGLATLRVGERIVRDRAGVRRERVRRLRARWLRRVSDHSTHAAIVRIRQQPIYLPSFPTEPPPVAESMPGAAERLRGRGQQEHASGDLPATSPFHRSVLTDAAESEIGRTDELSSA